MARIVTELEKGTTLAEAMERGIRCRTHITRPLRQNGQWAPGN
jgi:hypothetical protein